MCVHAEYGEWSLEEIASLKEGLRRFGRAWGKVYRQVGGRKTATQCKLFYDTFCTDKSLALQQALVEHSAIKVHTSCSSAVEGAMKLKFAPFCSS